MKVYWINEDQLRALEENKLCEDADEAMLWKDTMDDVRHQLVEALVRAAPTGRVTGRLMLRGVDPRPGEY